MIPDLGRYVVEVSLAYGASLALIAALAGWVWLRGRRVRRELAAIESRGEGRR